MRSIFVIFVVSACIGVTGCGSKVDVGKTSDSNVSDANNDNESPEEASGDDEGSDIHADHNEDSSSAEIQARNGGSDSKEIQLLRAQRAQLVQQIEYLRAVREQQYGAPRGGYRLGPGGGASRAGDNAARMAIAQDIDRLNAQIEQIDAAMKRHQGN